MNAAESRAKSDKSKRSARLRILNVALAIPGVDQPKRFKDPAAPTGAKLEDPNNAEANEVNLGEGFFA